MFNVYRIFEEICNFCDRCVKTSVPEHNRSAIGFNSAVGAGAGRASFSFNKYAGTRINLFSIVLKGGHSAKHIFVMIYFSISDG